MTCPLCAGRGEWEHQRPMSDRETYTSYICPRCDGSGVAPSWGAFNPRHITRVPKGKG